MGTPHEQTAQTNRAPTWLLRLLLLTILCGPLPHGISADVQPADSAPQSASRKFEDLSKSEKEAFNNKFMPLIVIVMLIFFFLAMTLYLPRISRFFKKRARIGSKDAPTEHPDAWSNYRLRPDEMVQDEDIRPS